MSLSSTAASGIARDYINVSIGFLSSAFFFFAMSFNFYKLDVINSGNSVGGKLYTVGLAFNALGNGECLE